MQMERITYSFKQFLKVRQYALPCMLNAKSLNLHRSIDLSKSKITDDSLCHVSQHKVTQSGACVIANYQGHYLQRRHKSNKSVKQKANTSDKEVDDGEDDEDEDEDDDDLDYTVPDDFEMKKLTPNRLESLLAHGLSKPTSTIQRYFGEGKVLFRGKKFTNKSYEPIDGDVFDVIHSDGEIRKVWRVEVVTVNKKTNTRNAHVCRCWVRPFPVEVDV